MTIKIRRKIIELKTKKNIPQMQRVGISSLMSLYLQGEAYSTPRETSSSFKSHCLTFDVSTADETSTIVATLGEYFNNTLKH